MNAADRTPVAVPAPHEREELEAALRRPDRLLELVLGAPDRLAADVLAGAQLPRLLVLLLLASTIFALPYGCIFGAAACWKVATLYLGATLICVPSLHVFATYLGLRMRFAPLLTLALAIPAVAGLFSLGFAPILGFLKATMSAATGPDTISWRSLSTMLLVAALAAGIAQLGRCLSAVPIGAGRRGLGTLVLGWLLVFLYVTARMASVLELW